MEDKAGQMRQGERLRVVVELEESQLSVRCQGPCNTDKEHFTNPQPTLMQGNHFPSPLPPWLECLLTGVCSGGRPMSSTGGGGLAVPARTE